MNNEANSLQGLTTQEAEIRLKKFGPNALSTESKKTFRKILKYFVSPISLMLIAASVLSFIIGKSFDGCFIFILLILNFAISFWQEKKADNAINALNQQIHQDIQTLRDGRWQEVNSENLVPEDVIKVGLGDVIPADCKIISQTNISINESSVTGESLPKSKNNNDKVFSGSFVATGNAILEITATSKNTYFGKTFLSVEKVQKKSLLESDIVRISKFLSALSILGVVLSSFYFIVIEHQSLVGVSTLDLSLLIAGIPISLPTVMTLIIEFGVINLAKKSAIVRRLSALEDLSNVSTLLTDKTGTLTENEILVKEIVPFEGFTTEQVLRFALVNAIKDEKSPIDQAIILKGQDEKMTTSQIKIINFEPFNFLEKMSIANVEFKNTKFTIYLGAPQKVSALCKIEKNELTTYESKVNDFAKKGFRTLALAVGKDNKEEKPRLAGVIALSDTLRADAKDVIAYLQANGVNVAMLTGDNVAIAKEIADELGLFGNIISKDEISKLTKDTVGTSYFQQNKVFAEILPDDKLNLVRLAKLNSVVAVTGDGVNDIPAAKAANVGIAVKSAVEALKNTADIVLLTNGIKVIEDAIFEARKIFERVYSYSVYRISESLRLIVTIVIIGFISSSYPLTVLQLILLALLNDIPIISLAYNRVEIPNKPSKLNVSKRFKLSSTYGMVGVCESLILFLIMKFIFNLPWEVIQTAYFLKLSVSGHMLIYVAHTKRRWFKFLPSKQVIWATSLTQLAATILALTGLFMPSPITIALVILVWAWSLFWMQINEVAKGVVGK